MPWSSQAQIAQLVIIEGPNDGLFVYNGTPALGTLIGSIASASGTDSFGNAYLAGVVSYNPIGAPTAIQMSNGQFTLNQAVSVAGPWVAVGSFHSFGAVSGGLREFGGLQMTAGTSLQFVDAGVLYTMVSPSGDTSGVNDRLAIVNATSGGGAALLLPGTFYLDSQITITGGVLAGCDMATTVQANTSGSLYTGALLAVGNKGTIRNLVVTNSGSDAITIAGGVTEVWLQDLQFSTNTGNCINWTITGTVHGRIRGIRGLGGGTANGGGIRIDGGTAGSRTAEINIYDIDIQNVTTSEVLFLSAVTDVLVSQVNGSIESVASGGTAPAGITVQGSCQTCHLLNLDVGGNVNSPAMQVIAAGGNSPSDLWVEGKLQQGSQGLVVSGATSRSRFYVNCTRNQGDGAQLNDTGTSNKIMFMGNLNNQAAGVAYDINVTSSGHWFIDAPQYGTPGGGAVTANLNISIAGNHVTHQFPPAGSTTAGNAASGW